MHEILYFVYHIFLASFNKKDKAKAQNFEILKITVKFSYIVGFLRILRYCQKHTVSLSIFGEKATFHFAFSLQMSNYTSSLNTLYTAESAQFYSMFLPTLISLTLCFH